MKRYLALSLVLAMNAGFSASDNVSAEVKALKTETQALKKQLHDIQAQISTQNKPYHTKSVKQEEIRSPDSVNGPSDDHQNQTHSQKISQLFKRRPLVAGAAPPRKPKVKADASVHNSQVIVRSIDVDPESVDFYPTALVADGRVLTYIAGTPVVTSPYLGSRPAFDGSDYIVNISSINRDIRLMQQRRNLYRAYEKEGYSAPNMPILMLSGKAEPMGYLGINDVNQYSGDWTFSSSELDLAAFLNDKVEGYMSIAYNQNPPPNGGNRVANSAFGLNMGFINIGDLDETPFYMTAGQLFAPFGRYSTGMVSAPLTMIFSRTRTRPFILGYKSQEDSGIFAAAYAFHSDASTSSHAAGGFNLGYVLNMHDFTGEIGASIISSVNDASGMQFTGATGGVFGGFGSYTNGSEDVSRTPAAGAHVTMSFDRYNLTAEWISNIDRFREQDLSYNGHGVYGNAGQVEAGVTFMLFNRPSGLSLGYQWTNQLLALSIPQQRAIATYNISIWKDTVESLEYRHDIDYANNNYANGAAPAGSVNEAILGTGQGSDMISAQIGVYF